MYQYNIDLVDLDPKEFNRVGKYYKDTVKTVYFLNSNNLVHFLRHYIVHGWPLTTVQLNLSAFKGINFKISSYFYSI